MAHDSDILDGLREALTVSPDNIPLRRQLATLLLNQGHVDEAEQELLRGLRMAPESEQLKVALGECYLRQGKPADALDIIQPLAQRPGCAAATLLLLAKLLLRLQRQPEAIKAYQQAKARDAKLHDDQLDALLHRSDRGAPAPEPGGGHAPKWSDDDDDLFGEDDDDIPFGGDEHVRISDISGHATSGGAASGGDVEKPKINFNDVGGMSAIKQQIDVKIIQPLKHPEIYEAYGKKIGGGILLYGPPGCGKTHLARATAGQVDAAFINVALHDVLSSYLGESERRLNALFEQARRHTPAVLFFDEVDALAASRSDLRESWSRRIINKFLEELDGVTSTNEGVLILAATNAPWHLDSAFRRPGRFDRILFVPPPDEPAREAILRILLKGKPLDEVDFGKLAAKAAKFSGADLKAAVDLAVESKLEEAIKSGRPSPLHTRDLLAAVKQVRPSTVEWFATARNYALYANEAGLYDDVLSHLKLK